MEMGKVICMSPTTFVFSSDNEVLFYNTDSGSKIKMPQSRSISDFVNLLLNPNNLYSIREEEIPNDNSVRELIESLALEFMVDFVEYDKAKPIVIPPFLKCHEQIWENKTGTVDSSLLTDLYIYLNGSCERNCLNCKKMSSQMTHCMKDVGEISLDEIERIISDIQSYTQPVSIHLCGGDIRKYSSLYELSILLKRKEISPLVHISYLNWTPSICKQLELCAPQYIFSVEIPINTSSIREVVTRCKLCNDRMEIVVASDDDIEMAENIIKREKLKAVSIIPFYDGSNLDFFQRHVFVEEDDIIQSRPSKQMIFRRMLFNINNIGKIILRSNGKYYSNLNKPALGKKDQPLSSIIEKEWRNGESWRNIRSWAPCSSCVYQYLCPSPSNYEYVIGKNNLCMLNNKR